jgi:hypothetical protein
VIVGNGAAALRAMGRLDKVLERLAALPRQIAVDVAPEITRQLRAGFRSGLDPYGRAWRPLKASTIRRGRRPPPLSDSRRLAASTMAIPSRSGLRLMVGRSYGTFHQTGFRNGPTRVSARKILPDHGMPASWSAALRRSAQKLAREASRGAA